MITKEEFLKYPDTKRLLSLIEDQRLKKYITGFDLNVMCSTAEARRDALNMLRSLEADVIESYEAVEDSHKTLTEFVTQSTEQADSRIKDIEVGYRELSEICARAMLAAVRDTPAYPEQIKRMQQFCELLANFVSFESRPFRPQPNGATLFAFVKEQNRRSLSVLGLRGFSRQIHQLDTIRKHYAKTVTYDFVSAYVSKKEFNPTYFALRSGDNPIVLGNTNRYLGYDNLPDLDKTANEREMVGALGSFSTVSYEMRPSGMFAFFPFEEQRSHIDNMKINFFTDEQTRERYSNFKHFICDQSAYLEIYDTAPYRIFALAEVCFVKLLFRERSALLNVIQAERAYDTLNTLTTAANSASTIYYNQRAKNAEKAFSPSEKKVAAKTVPAKTVPAKTVPAKKVRITKTTSAKKK